MGCFKSQVVFRKIGIHYRALLRKMTYKDKTSYDSMPPCSVLSVSGLVVDSITERWGAGVETQKMVRGEIGGWGRVPFNETYAPSLSTIYDGA